MEYTVQQKGREVQFWSLRSKVQLKGGSQYFLKPHQPAMGISERKPALLSHGRDGLSLLLLEQKWFVKSQPFTSVGSSDFERAPTNTVLGINWITEAAILTFRRGLEGKF